MEEVEEKTAWCFRCQAWGQGLTKGHQAHTHIWAMGQLRGNPGQRILFRQAGGNKERQRDRETDTHREAERDRETEDRETKRDRESRGRETRGRYG